MKTVQAMSLDVDLVTALKARADAEGRPLSRLANELLRASLRMGGSTPENPMRKRAQLVLGAITALTEAASKLPPTDPQWMFREFRIDQVCRKLGSVPSTTLPFLRECERAEALKCSVVSPLGMDKACPKVDHWRLPTE